MIFKERFVYALKGNSTNFQVNINLNVYDFGISF